jgi:hypothetical protein
MGNDLQISSNYQVQALARAGKSANGPTCLKRSPVDAML